MKELTRDQLLTAPHPAPRPVDLPELGGRAYVRMMTGQQRDEWETEFLTAREEGRTNLRALLIARTACDRNGTPLFGPDDVDDLAALPATVSDKLYAAAARFNRITKDDVDELEGNSSASRSATSPSDSPPRSE